MRVLLTLALFLLCVPPLAAQHGQHTGHTQHTGRTQHGQPYGGEQHRRIKALSEAEVRGYLDGEGMGYAMAAELNHYPGPRHVLELAEPLGLSAEQQSRTRALFESMRAEASALGARVVDREAELDRLFATRQIDDERMRAVLHEIAGLQAELRAVHLRAHLAMRDLLDAEQIARYDRLRGYADDAAPDARAHPAHRHP